MFNIDLDVELLLCDIFEKEMKKRKKTVDSVDELIQGIQYALECLIESIGDDYKHDKKLE